MSFCNATTCNDCAKLYDAGCAWCGATQTCTDPYTAELLCNGQSSRVNESCNAASVLLPAAIGGAAAAAVLLAAGLLLFKVCNLAPRLPRHCCNESNFCRPALAHASRPEGMGSIHSCQERMYTRVVLVSRVYIPNLSMSRPAGHGVEQPWQPAVREPRARNTKPVVRARRCRRWAIDNYLSRPRRFMAAVQSGQYHLPLGGSEIPTHA